MAKVSHAQRNAILLGALLACFLFVQLPPASAAPPDTPPALTWLTQLSETGAISCPGGVRASQIVQETNAGDLWVAAHCYSGSTSNGVIRFRVSSSGSIESRGATTCGGTNLCDGVSVAMGPNNMPIFSFAATTPIGGCAAPTERVQLFYDTSDAAGSAIQLDCNIFTGVITGNNDDNGEKVDWTIVDQDTIQYYIGSNSHRGAARCPYPQTANASQCTLVYSISGNPGCEYTNNGLPYRNISYCQDNNAGTGTPSIYVLNRTTGALTNDHVFGDGVFSSADPPQIATTGTSVFGVGVNTPTFSQIRFYEHNATTLVPIRSNYLPIDPIPITTETDLVLPTNFYLDGANNAFVCGQLTNAGGTRYKSFVAKFNTTTSAGQRWNLTFDQHVINTDREEASSCYIGPAGDLYVATVVNNPGIGWLSYLRKYAGAGTARSPVDQSGLIDIPTPTATTTPGAADFGTGMVNFAQGIGFVSEGGLFFFGLILVMIVFAISAGAIMGVSESRPASLFAGGIGAVGTMAFNGIQSVWPEWTVVVLIMATVALGAYLLRRSGALGVQ